MLDGLSNYLVFELKKTVLFIWSPWSCKQHMPSPPHGLGSGGISPFSLQHLISVCCALHRESRNSPSLYKSDFTPWGAARPVRICGEWHSLFGRILLLLPRQITVSGMKPLGSKGRRWTHWCGGCWQLCQNQNSDLECLAPCTVSLGSWHLIPSVKFSDNWVAASLSKLWPCFSQQLKVIIQCRLPALHRTCHARLSARQTPLPSPTQPPLYKSQGPHILCPPGFLWYQHFPTHSAMNTSDLPQTDALGF